MQANTPLSDIRVLNIGIGWAGRVSSMLLAEQGAEVIEVVRPARNPHPSDPVLDRSKRLLKLDAKKPGGREKLAALAKSADVIIENNLSLSKKFNVDYSFTPIRLIFSCDNLLKEQKSDLAKKIFSNFPDAKLIDVKEDKDA